MVRIQRSALLWISPKTCLAYFASRGLQPEKIAKRVYRQADVGTIMGIIFSSNPIIVDLRQLSLEFLRETHKKYFIIHEKDFSYLATTMDNCFEESRYADQHG